jgi:site-specific DNA recombinase
MSEPAAIYLRVSTDEQAQDGHVSLDVQRLRCQEYAQRHGMVIVAEYVDVESAYEGRRLQFQQMLQDAEAGRFRHIIVFRADRFSRDVADASLPCAAWSGPKSASTPPSRTCPTGSSRP